jgi:hypothetical protein
MKHYICYRNLIEIYSPIPDKVIDNRKECNTMFWVLSETALNINRLRTKRQPSKEREPKANRYKDYGKSYPRVARQ